MRHRWAKAAAVGFLVFLGLWVGGVVRGWAQPAPPPAWPVALSGEWSARLPAANNLREMGLERTPLPVVLDQPGVERIRVFEKTAQLAAGTTAFDDDEAQVRAGLAAHQARVFTERSVGIAPERRLTLEVGAHPDRFDALVEQLRRVAHLGAVSVQQRDRTEEFRRLHGQRQSLKSHLESIQKLRGAKDLSIDDALKLEQKVQDIEKELQGLSVQFGDLLGEESFYHVYLTLSEHQPGSRLDRAYTLPRRLATAFLWALGWWLAAALAVALMAATYVSVQTLRTRPAAPAALHLGGGPAA